MTRTTDSRQDGTRAELERVLDIYGADTTRWPAARRETLVAFARSDTQAARLLAEAQAVDAALALAPAGRASQRLKSDIVAAAVGDASREARVVPLSAAKPRPRRPAPWQAAALLAASFALGLYLGVAGVADTALQGTLNYASADTGGELGDSLFSSAGSWLSDQEERQ